VKLSENSRENMPTNYMEAIEFVIYLEYPICKHPTPFFNECRKFNYNALNNQVHELINITLSYQYST